MKKNRIKKFWMQDFITEEMRSIDSQQHVVADCVNQINKPGWVTNSHRSTRTYEVISLVILLMP